MDNRSVEPARPYVSVDLVVSRNIDDQPQVLLTTEPMGPCVGMSALPGGLLGYQEALTDAAARVLKEANLVIEAGELFFLDCYQLVYRQFPEWTISHVYMIDADALLSRPDLESVGDCQWAPVASLLADAARGTELAYHHSAVLGSAARRLQVP